MSLGMHDSRLKLKAEYERLLEQAKKGNDKDLIDRLERDIERLEELIKRY